MFFALSILFLTTICFSSAGKIDHWSVGNIIITDPTIRFRLDIYSPTTPGSYPVLIYLPGLAGLVPSTFYTTMVTTIAQQNVILIGISKIENIKPEKISIHIATFLEWIIKPNDGATRLFAEHKAVKDVLPNMDRLGFLTHSSAAHSLGQYLNTTCGPLKLIIMMNPVDGIDPFGIVQDFITHPPTPLPFRTPTLIISAGLDNVSVGKKTPACAPNNISNDRWYRSLYGPTFLINITDYGHADNLDEPFHEASKLMCTSCKGSICHFSQYKTDEATLITSFVHAIFNRDLQQLQIIKNPQVYLQSHVLNKYDLHGYNYTSGGPGGFCTHD
ncbi:unnamed protein product [Adineta steineri]|uniref:Chlorophyllase n=1 Tax=Adineta steineri TaxID=433720 RepID=A0A814RG59_9BILA|nr:unnamed protein product [Adineta steineri]CAF3542905.1 unnamed protein product [Adineta steineri]